MEAALGVATLVACWCCAWPGSPRCRCKSAVSTPRVRPPGWRRAVMSARPSLPPAASLRLAPVCNCAATAASSSRLSPPGRICCLACISPRPQWRRSNRGDERGSATVVAAAMVVVLLTVTGGGVYLGLPWWRDTGPRPPPIWPRWPPRRGCLPEPSQPARRPTRWPARCGLSTTRLRQSTTWTSSSPSRCLSRFADGARRRPPPGQARPNGLVVGWIGIGQPRVGEFGLGRQPHRDQAGERVRLRAPPG